MTLPIVITKHAVRRYIERILGFDFTAYDRLGMDDYLSVDLACEKLGIDVRDVEATIEMDVEPRVPATARLRGSRRIVRGEKGKYVIGSGCYVVTAMPLDWVVT
jgi:hypothetical protein